MDIFSKLREQLDEKSGKIGQIYARTYHNLVSRVEESGYIQESLTGLYSGMFFRTVGSLGQLFSETGNDDEIERMLRFSIDCMVEHDLERMPQVVNRDRSLISLDDQIDGQAHVLLAWAKLAQKRPDTAFIKETYPVMAKLMRRSLQPPYFLYQTGVPDKSGHKQMRLILNIALEHSRECRRWMAFDLLTQSFVGAAATEMVKVAHLFGDVRNENDWHERVEVLRSGVQDNLTREVDGKTVYLEMLLPDGGSGRPFLGMGWLCYAPIAAEWEAGDRNVLVNTIELLKEKLYVEDPCGSGTHCLIIEFDESGHEEYQVIGKGYGWDIDYCRQQKQYARILEGFDFINRYHDKPIYMENIRIIDGKWKIVDAGNGEQASWWCWAIARLRKEVGLPAIPQKIE